MGSYGNMVDWDVKDGSFLIQKQGNVKNKKTPKKPKEV